jgi:putative spermidine/putrescine transport system permease protein
VTPPLVRRGVLVGALFAFIISFDELIVALLMSGSGVITLRHRMWDDMRFAIDPTIGGVLDTTIVLTATLLLGTHVLRRQQAGRQRVAGN